MYYDVKNNMIVVLKFEDLTLRTMVGNPRMLNNARHMTDGGETTPTRSLILPCMQRNTFTGYTCFASKISDSYLCVTDDCCLTPCDMLQGRMSPTHNRTAITLLSRASNSQ